METLDNSKQISKTNSNNNVKANTTRSNENSYQTNVKNFDELVQTFDEAKTSEYEEYVINLEDGDYSITESIQFNQGNVHSIVIDGNSQTFLTAENFNDRFFSIGSGYALTLNNIVFKQMNCSEANSAIFNGGSLAMNNVTITDLYQENNFIISANGTMTIQDSEIYNNYLGRSIILMGDTNLKVVNTKFINNTVNSEDYSVCGIINSLIHSRIELDNVLATESYSNYGSLVCGFGDTEIIVLDSVINNNEAKVGGAIYGASINLLVNNTQFRNNKAKSVGGAIAIKRVAFDALQESQIYICNSYFEENDGGTSGGGAIYAEDTTMEVIESKFNDNTAYFGGAICHLTGQLTIDSSSFYDNYADFDGGALFLMYINASINNSNLTENYANEEGNAILVAFSDNVELTQSIIENYNTKCENTDLIDATGNKIIDISFSTLTGTGDEIIDNENNEKVILNNNWWGENNPNFEKLTEGIIPDTWYIIDKAYVSDDDKYQVMVKIDTQNNGEENHGLIPTRTVEFISSTGSFDDDELELDEFAYTYYSGDIDDAYAIVDNEIIKFNSKLTPYMFSDDESVIINNTVTLKLNVNPDITGNFTLQINGKTITGSLSQNDGQILYTLPANYNAGNQTVSWIYSGNNKYEEYRINSTIVVLENKTVSTIIIPVNTVPGLLNVSNITEFPSRYDLRELGLVTPVKDQGKDGVCWTFGTMSALESNILKALNKSYDLSENHIKNTLRVYSFVGNMEYPTDGGLYVLSSGYLASLYGPVLEEFDPYDEDGTISPLSDDIVIIVRDTYFISPRKNSLDNDEIKAALMNYGAVATSIGVEDNCWSDETKTNHYNPDNQTNHAIAIVGWDDNYSRYNFKCTDSKTGEILIPEGDGAFIIKNSWGTDVGDEGFMYVSYYDASLATTEIPMGVMVYVINNTEEYNGVYEFDTTANDETSFNSTELWIKNIFTVAEDHFVKAVGTVFLQDSEYTINIYRNGILVHSQDGIVQDGYRTIKLDKYVSVEEDDNLTVEVRIKSLDSTIVNVLIQHAKEYKRPIQEGVSFVSKDGAEWTDLMTNEEPSYVVLKAYADDCEHPVTTTNIVSNNLTITTKLNDSGNVTFKINGESICDTVLNNGEASTSFNVENVTTDYLVITTIISTEDNIYEQNVTIPLVKDNKTNNDTNHTKKTVPKKNINSKEKTSVVNVLSTNKQFNVIFKDKIIYTGNVITLKLLNEIFNESFINGHLLVYLDGKLVFNGTVGDDLSTVILEIIENLIGNHELKVVFTDNENQTNTYTENITIK